RHDPVEGHNLLRVGHQLRSPYHGAPYHGKIEDITSAGVKFQWGRGDILVPVSRLAREGIEPRTMPGLHAEPMDEAELARTAEENKKSRPLDDHSWFIGSVERDRIIVEYEEMKREVGVGPDYNNREKRMYVRITKIPKGSLVEQRGFKVGDILRRINGTDIVSKSDLVRYIQRHPDQPRYKIEILRRGTRLTKDFDIAR
ncbi:MAG: PDZ domain-containing protein, partial [Planctomycetota bacterium]